MPAPLKYTVRYSGKEALKRTAKFCDHDDAMGFARQQSSAEVSLTVGRGKGLIGQFRHGKATPEFAHLDRSSDEDGGMYAYVDDLG